MKNRIIFILLAVLGITATACVSEQEMFLPTDGDVVFYATNGDIPSSKTVLLQDGSIKWKPADQISIFYGNSSFQFSSTNTDLASEVEFHGVLDGIEYTDGGEFWAVYPYRESNSFDGSSVTVTLPDEQTAVAGTFDDDLFISLAKTRDYNLRFYNVCGGVRFTVTQPDVKSVTFKGNNNEPIAGKAKVRWNKSGTPEIQSVVSPKTTITVTAPDGGSFEVGEWYYIVCFPATLSSGYTLTMNTQLNAFTSKTGARAVTIKRSVWGSLEGADSNLIYDIPHNEIWYTTVDGKPLTRHPTAYKYLDPYDSDDDEEATFVSSTYENGIGIFRYEEPIVHVGYYNPSSSDLSALKTITFPGSMTSIGRLGGSFPSLELVTFKASLRENYKYYWNPFPNSPKLQYAGPNAEIIPNYLVVGNKLVSFAAGCGLTEISVGGNDYSSKGINEIGNSCFYCANTLQRVSVESPISDIGRGAFDGCEELISVTLGPGVTYIGSTAFQGCSQLASVSLPSTLIQIGECAFSMCRKLEELLLPDSVSTICAAAFEYSGLKKAEIPASVTKLGDYSFSGCPLDTVTLLGETPPDCKWYDDDEECNYDAWRPFDGPYPNYGSYPIYVPYRSIDAYKTSKQWSKYSSRFVINPVSYGLVDLGLSVLWSTCNLGADSPEDYGDYYAWGETSPKTSDWQSYKYCINGSWSTDETKFTKYNKDDNLMTLVPEDDVAYATLGDKWHIPTVFEWGELVDNCTWSWTSVNGVYGFKVRSKISGYTDRWIFLPAAGGMEQSWSGVHDAGTEGYYWSSSLNPTNRKYAQYLDMYSSRYYDESLKERANGYSIRPVYPVERKPIATPDIVDLGLSVKWASFNLGATAPEEYGDHYSWGETEMKGYYTAETYKWGPDHKSFTKYVTKSSSGTVDNRETLETGPDGDDVASKQLGGNWRMPTIYEMSELVNTNNCSWKWTSINGKTGYKVTSKKDGFTDKWIFLPAVGYVSYSHLKNTKTDAFYWTSSLDTGYNYYANGLYFNSSNIFTSTYERYEAYCIRPVCDD